MAEMQQMQVIVPPGIGPGMPFTVLTPAGQMQVVCPEGAVAGGQMVVNVPAVQSAQPMPIVQPMMMAAPPVASAPIIMGATVVEQPMEMAAPPQPQVMAVVQPQPQVMAATWEAAPPQPQAMARAPMEGRVEEIQLGCYGQQGAPCCWLMSLSWKDSDRTVITAGPGCFCCCCIGCCPGCCGQFKATEKGSAIFKNGETWTFQSPTSFIMTGGMASGGETYRKMC